jgi:hypothetical protein
MARVLDPTVDPISLEEHVSRVARFTPFASC